MSDFSEESLMNEKDLYALIGVNRGEYFDESMAMDAVKKRHAKIMLDTMDNKDSEDRKKAEAVYSILKDDDKRTKYNKKHDIKFGFAAQTQKLEEEMFGRAGKTTTTTTTTTTNTTTTTTTANTNTQDDAENNPAPSSQPPLNFDGESRAYDNVEYDLYGNPKKKEEKKPSSAGGGIKKPKREPAKGGGGGKNIMDVFWNEIIVPSYTSCIAGATDLTLDFVDYVLFDAYIPQEVKKEEKKEEKNDIWDIGLGVYNKYEDSIKKGMSVFSKAHAELLENIEKEKAGVPTTWNVWPNKKEPSFFKDIVEISKKAEQDPNSPEAETWKRFNSMPEIMETQFNKELLLRKLSISMATMEVALDTEKFTLPKDINKKIQEIEGLTVSAKDEAKYKKDMKEKVKELRELIKDDTAINKELSKKADEIEKILADSDKKLEDKKKLVSQQIGNMKNIKPIAQEKEIDDKSQAYYNDMRQNIEKIKEVYKTDPDKARETIEEYLKSIAEETKPAMPVVDKYLKAGRLQRAMAESGKKIEIFVKGKILNQPIPVDDTLVVDQMKEKAEESFKKSTDSISEFVVDGQKVGSRMKAAQNTDSPFSKKYGIFNLYNSMSGRK